MIITINDKDVGIKNISTLLRKVSFVFNLKGKLAKDYDFQITAKSIDAVSALVLFKIFEYAFKNDCFNSPKANLKHIILLFTNYGLEKFLKNLINQEEVEGLYKKLKPYKTDTFFIAPHLINRDNFKSKEGLETKYAKFIADYYQDTCPDLIQYFNTCICEIASNFLYHALEDNNSILMAQGNQNKIEIVCVDNSEGIVSTLNPKSKNHKKTMIEAFEKSVSSKLKEGHCGTGLWYIRKITEHLNGVFIVHSEDMSYICKGGKVFVRKSVNWKGSVVYLKLNVGDSKSVNEFFTNLLNESKLDLRT